MGKKKVAGAIGALLGILLILLLVWFMQRTEQTQLIGLGGGYTIPLRDYDVFINFYDKYWDIAGCKAADCGNQNACNVWSESIGTKLGCPIVQCFTSGWFNCPDNYRNVCPAGNNCDSNDHTCGIRCDWEDRHVASTGGGVNYQNYDNCAWYAQIKDKQGNLLKEYSAKTKYGQDWEKDQYYRELINDRIGNVSIKYLSDNYGVVQRRADGSAIFSCISVKFQVEDIGYKRHNICLGNDGLDEPDCTTVDTETCVLQCPNNVQWQLDYDNCRCVEKVCTSNTDCSDGYICSQSSCVPNPEPEKKTNWLLYVGVAGGIALLLILSAIIFRRK